MKPVILFDVDHTLFDTTTWFQEFLKPVLAEALNTETENIARVADEYVASLEKSTDFNATDFRQWLGEEFEVEADSIRKLFFTPQYFERSLYRDVKPCLHSLETDYTLGIFSEGVADWQRPKIELSGLQPFLDSQHVYIYRRKLLPEVLAALPACTIVDDRQDVVIAISDYEQLQPIWLNRHNQATDDVIPTIHSLTDLIAQL